MVVDVEKALEANDEKVAKNVPHENGNEVPETQERTDPQVTVSVMQRSKL